MEKLHLTILLASLTTLFLLFYLFFKGLKLKELGYKAYPENLPRKKVSDFTETTILKVIGTTKERGLFVIQPQNSLSKIILIDMVNYIPHQLIHVQFMYKVTTSTDRNGNLSHKINQNPPKDGSDREYIIADEVVLE